MLRRIIWMTAVALGLPVLAAAQPPAGPSLARSGVSQSLNPDISALTHVETQWRKPDGANVGNETGVREVELAVQGAVDPYGRADLFIAVAPGLTTTEVELEEGYWTSLRLPGSLQARLGKWRARFGKNNRTHWSELPMVDPPAVLRTFLGADGLRDPGAGLVWVSPLPWYVDLTWDHLFHAGSPGAFTATGRTEVLRLRNFWDLSASEGLELGGSWGADMSGLGAFENLPSDRASLVGADLTYKWRPPQQAIYRSFLVQGEVLRSSAATYGWYGLAQYQLGRRWYLGARYDWTQSPADDMVAEAGPGAMLSFLPSEFSRILVEWRRIRGGTDPPRHEVGLRLSFGLGPHRPHVAF